MSGADESVEEDDSGEWNGFGGSTHEQNEEDSDSDSEAPELLPPAASAEADTAPGACHNIGLSSHWLIICLRDRICSPTYEESTGRRAARVRRADETEATVERSTEQVCHYHHATPQQSSYLRRMSEQNIATILDGIEEIYRNHRRHGKCFYPHECLSHY